MASDYRARVQGFANPVIVNLPDSAWNGKSGSYTIQQLNFASGKEFIITLYDKTGFAKGVNSDVLQVGDSRTKQQCNTTGSSPDFTYGAPDALTQCLNYRFTDYETAQPPVTVNGARTLAVNFGALMFNTGIIAGGSIFQRTAGAKVVEFPIQVDIHSGTRLIFWMQYVPAVRCLLPPLTVGKQGTLKAAQEVQPRS